MKRTTVTVYTPYFKAKTSERQKEIDICLKKNLQCDAIDQIILLIDDGSNPPETNEKISIIRTNERATYSQWLRLTIERGDQDISVLANSDIYFDESIYRIAEILRAEKSFIALSRHDKCGEDLKEHPNPAWSQDVWAIGDKNNLTKGMLHSLDIPLGVPRCDNKIAYIFATNGWKIFNPMRSIMSVHVHETQQRNYNKKTDLTILGGVAYVEPSTDERTPSKINIDVWACGTDRIQGVQLNRSLDAWMAEDGAPKQKSSNQKNEEEDSFRKISNSISINSLQEITTGGDKKSNEYSIKKIDDEPKKLIYSDELNRFKLIEKNGYIYGIDVLARTVIKICEYKQISGIGNKSKNLLEISSLLLNFIDPILPTDPIIIKEKPLGKGDNNFWQYPAATERQAYENHETIAKGANIDLKNRIVNTYLGLPWATYIDKKSVPVELQDIVAPRILGLRRLAQGMNFKLRVHTVCQQIYWRRLEEIWKNLGITDLHISHATRGIEDEKELWGFRIHSWPLFAPNIEVAERREGLIIGKPIRQKRYLASFVGAHMQHYRSDIRVKLCKILQSQDRPDLLAELNDEWHFNKNVYLEQVQQKKLKFEDEAAQKSATKRYNQILSESIFSLCPEGAGPNTLRIWESLAVGSIPVIIADEWIPPELGLGSQEWNSCAVFITQKEIYDIISALESIPLDELEHRQSLCMKLYKRISKRTTFLVD